MYHSRFANQGMFDQTDITPAEQQRPSYSQKLVFTSNTAHKLKIKTPKMDTIISTVDESKTK